MRWVCLLLLVSCACSELEGRYIRRDLDGAQREAEEGVGVSYYLTRPSFAIQRKTLAGGKKASPVNEMVVTSTPDVSRRFEVGMDPGLFSSDSFEVTLADSGTISALSAESTDVTAKTVAELGKFVAGVAADLLASEDDEKNGFKRSFDKAKRTGVLAPGVADAASSATDRLDFRQTAANAGADVAAFTTAAQPLIRYLSGLDGEAKTGYEHVPALLDALAATEAALAPRTARSAADGQQLDGPAGAVHRRLQELERLERAVAALRVTVPPVSKTMAGLKKAVDEALARNLAAPTSRTTELDDAIRAYQAAVRLVLDADHAVGGRALARRRDVLVEFLSRDIPDAAALEDEAAYTQFSAELNAVSAAIDGALGLTAAKAADDLPLGTDVTSRVDEKVHLDRFADRLDPDRLKMYVAVGRARVRFDDDVDASFVVHPVRGE